MTGDRAEEEAFPGRCAEAGDELGSAVVTARLARELMRLWLLMHRRYPPYSKWLGSAFAQVPGGAGLGRHLSAALAAAGWPARERELVRAYRIVAEAHNGLGLTEPLDPGTRPYYDRPYQVLDAGRFAAALTAAITDPLVRRLGPAWHGGPGPGQHAGPRRSPLRQGRYLGIWYLIEICRSWGSVIPRPNLGVLND